VLLAVVLGLIIATSDPEESRPAAIAGLAPAILIELAIGFVLGLGLRLMISALQLVAQLVELQIGFSMFEEAGANGSALRRLYTLTTIALFLAASGHRMIVTAILDVPNALGLFTGDATGSELIFRLITAAWCLALNAALPLIVALSAVHLSSAMIARVVPQFGLTGVAVPIQLVIGLILIFVSVSSVCAPFGRGLAWVLGSTG
jgi:flagellar biosynthetic protein FliR